LSVDANAVFGFMCLFVDVHPIHDWRDVGNRCDQALMFGVWVRQVIASVRMSERFAIFGAGVNVQLPVSQGNNTAIEFATSPR
jgi:hypothetical protein